MLFFNDNTMHQIYEDEGSLEADEKKRSPGPDVQDASPGTAGRPQK